MLERAVREAMMEPDRIDAETLAGMMRKAARIIERAARHDTFGSQRLWDLSAGIKEEAARILSLRSERAESSDR